jgi:hypothetical protein
MQIKGIKQGETIELLQRIDSIPDGVEVSIDILYLHPLSQLSLEERRNRIDAILGAWQGDTEIDTIFAELDRERHCIQGRSLAELNE